MAGASSAVTTKRELGKATRDAFGRALEALGSEHPDVVVVDADVGNSTRTEWFGMKFPDRFFNIGIAEHRLGHRQQAIDGAEVLRRHHNHEQASGDPRSHQPASQVSGIHKLKQILPHAG